MTQITKTNGYLILDLNVLSEFLRIKKPLEFVFKAWKIVNKDISKVRNKILKIPHE